MPKVSQIAHRSIYRVKWPSNLKTLKIMKLANTPIHSINVDGYRVFVKRDDLLHPYFSGNKARKFAYFLEHEFDGIYRLIGYGSPQANSLYSMSALARLKGWRLDFYVDHIASHLSNNPSGNYLGALNNGANIIDLSLCSDRRGRAALDYIEQELLPNQQNTLFVPEGGRCAYAEFGVRRLAMELNEWKKQQNLAELTIFLPSGTGTTALFLQKSFYELASSIKVVTCAVVGDCTYLKSQFTQLSANLSHHPHVVALAKRHHFGKLYREFYDIWNKVNETGITFELLYDPLGWLNLTHYMAENSDETIVYLHQGGLLGNESMLPRYQRKYPLSGKAD